MAMLGGACNPCCNRCALCPAGQQLPDAVTITFFDVPDTYAAGINNTPVSLPFGGGDSTLCRYEGCVNGVYVAVDYYGPETPILIKLFNIWHVAFSADSSLAPFSCDPFTFTASQKVHAPAGYATVAPSQSIVGRCWSHVSESLPETVTIEISGARDLDSRIKVSPLPASEYGGLYDLPGIAYRHITKLEFLNGTYEMRYVGLSGFFNCQTHAWEYCFPQTLMPCGGFLQLHIPRFAGRAELWFINSNMPHIALKATSASLAPNYPQSVEQCPPFSEDTSPSQGETLSRSVIKQNFGWSYNYWEAIGSCYSGSGEMVFRDPWPMTRLHKLEHLAGRALPHSNGYVLQPDGSFLNKNLFIYRDAGSIIDLDTDDAPLVVTAKIKVSQSPADLITLGLDINSCFGSGAMGGAQAQNFGPITAVTLTHPGSGYAKLGRRQPTLSIAGASATFTLTQQLGPCDLPYWTIGSISVSPGAVGFADGQPLSVTASAGDTVEVAAQGTITTQRAEPSLNAAASAGSGAVFSVSTANNGDGTWRVDSVTFTGTTAGYLDGDYLAFSGTGVTEEQSAYARIVTGRIEPTVAVSVQSYAGGSGAVLTPTLTPGTAWHDGRTIWSISSLLISAAGSGYEVGDFITAMATDGQQDQYYYFYGVVEGVDSSGGISAYSIYEGGGFFKSDGFISSVVVDDGGRYHVDEIASVTLTKGGRYYREDHALPAITSPITVSVLQPEGSSGSGAVIDAAVNLDTSSPLFGELSGLTLISGGNHYTTRQHVNSCLNPFP